jgi:hypothetical protein
MLTEAMAATVLASLPRSTLVPQMTEISAKDALFSPALPASLQRAFFDDAIYLSINTWKSENGRKNRPVFP